MAGRKRERQPPPPVAEGGMRQCDFMGGEGEKTCDAILDEDGTCGDPSCGSKAAARPDASRPRRRASLGVAAAVARAQSAGSEEEGGE